MAQAFSTNLGIGPIPEFDSDKYPGIFNDSIRIRNALTTLQGNLDKYTGALPLDSHLQGKVGASSSVRLANITRFYAIASVALSFGQMVNFFSTAGVIQAQKADAVTPLYAKAFCSSTSPVAAGALGEFVLLGVLSGLSGLAPSANYYLANSPGFITPFPGTTSQILGYALSATELYFNPQIL
jgi:hypothetical protein